MLFALKCGGKGIASRLWPDTLVPETGVLGVRGPQDSDVEVPRSHTSRTVFIIPSPLRSAPCMLGHSETFHHRLVTFKADPNGYAATSILSNVVGARFSHRKIICKIIV